jgi:hypothetical protein
MGMIRDIDYRIPLDLMESLLDGQHKVNTTSGAFIVNGLNDLRHVTIAVPEDQGSSRQSNGYYCARGFAPVLSAPRKLQLYGTPVWVPALSRYGYWDEDDTQQLLLYPEGLTWQDIEADLSYYLGTYLRRRRNINDLANWADMVRAFDYVPGNLTTIAEGIAALPVRQREMPARDFVARYERILTDFSLSADLYTAYQALVSVYMSLADFAVQREDIGYIQKCHEVIGWLERGIVIIDRFKQHDMPVCSVFSNALMRLSLWHSNSGNFKVARQFSNAWKSYDPGAAKACEKLQDLIAIKQALVDGGGCNA